MSVAITSGFDFYQKLPIQNSVMERLDMEISPLNALQPGSPIEFSIVTGDGDSMYLDLADSYFVFRCKVTKSTGEAPKQEDEVSCVQNLAHSMWQRVQVYLGDKEIGDSNALYAHRAYIASLLSHGKHAQQYWMENQGWWGKDTAGKLDSLRCQDDAQDNKGVWARNQKVGLGAEFELLMYPIHELFTNTRYISPGVSLKIRLTPNSNAFILKRGTGNDAPKLVILDAKFNCVTMKATSVQDVAIIQSMKSIGPLNYDLRAGGSKYLSLGTGKTTGDLDNIFLGNIPNRIAMFMVRDDAIAGSYALNPFNLQHFGLDYIVLMVNGKYLPTQPLTPDFANKRYIKTYNKFLEGLQKTRSEIPVPISYDEYAKGHTIFVFDLTPDGNSETSYSPLGRGSVRIQLKFKEPLAQAIDIFFIAEGDGGAAVDANKNVTYNNPL